jgi:hypothetical protein
MMTMVLIVSHLLMLMQTDLQTQRANTRLPVLGLDAASVSVEEGARHATMFVAARGIQRLNVAGPRESHWPGGRPFARSVVRALLMSVPLDR